MKHVMVLGAFSACLAACTGNEAVEDVEDKDGAVEQSVIAIPDSLAPFGDGYPNPGDACRRLGESAATVDFLDDSAVLVGCASANEAEALGGSVVDTIEGVTVVSIPTGDANEGINQSGMGDRSTAAGTSVSGNVTGNGLATHSFAATAGQTINVTLSGAGTMYFNVIPPGGGSGDAIFVGSQALDGDFWSGVAPTTGDYQVVIYLMGSDRDTGAKRDYELKFVSG